MEFQTKKTIRYMGNKNRLLDFIIPEILKNTKNTDIVFDLMGGTCCVGYALKPYRTVYENDVQYYSYVIASGLIKNNNKTISSNKAAKLLSKYFKDNIINKHCSFFEKNYSNTYFSKEQCLEIDSIRYSINKIRNKTCQFLFLISLMRAMCSCQSTPGHFAQYLPCSHPRLKTIRTKSIWSEFLKKCDDFNNVVDNKKQNKCFNLDYKKLIRTKDFKKASLVYIDPPYTGEQYSRFYHILETVCKYDNPNLEHKGLYRKERFISPLSLKNQVLDEFDSLLSNLSKLNKKVILSYSTKGLLKENQMDSLFKKYFKKHYLKRIKYSHSTQGKGSVNLEELLFVGLN